MFDLRKWVIYFNSVETSSSRDLVNARLTGVPDYPTPYKNHQSHNMRGIT